MIYWGAWSKRNWIPNLKERKNSRFSKYFLFSGENNYGRGSLVQKKKSSNLSLLTRAKYWIKNPLSLVRKWSSAKNKAFHAKVGEGECVFSPISYNQKWARLSRHVCLSQSGNFVAGRSFSLVGPHSLWFPEKGQRRGVKWISPLFPLLPPPQARGGYCITHSLHERKGVGFWLGDKLTEK